MKLNGKLLSAILSCVLTGSIMIPTAYAESNTDTSHVNIYNSTNAEESKEQIENSSTQESQTEPVEDVPFNVFKIIEAHKEFVGNIDVPPIYLNSKGIDVSQWQGTVDWSKVKESGVDFAIIRSGYGKYSSQEDPKFDENMKGAQEAGIACGTYWYSYALSVEEAIQEAEVCYEIIKDYDFTYPVYFDIEDSSQLKLSTTQISAIIDAFCSTLKDKGYYVGLYSYANFLTTRVLSSVIDKYDIWVAHFDVDAPDFSGEYGMWQYTCTGSVNGIYGDVDMNYAYLNYPYIISPETYVPNKIPPNEQVTPPSQIIEPVDNPLTNGIDVSFWQGTVDWKTVADSGIDYAIIRAGYGNSVSQIDTKFIENVQGAKEAGIGCGVYWYSYAESPEDAVREAQACCEIIKDYKFEYPIYFNIEDPIFNSKSKEEITAITEAFCSYIEEQGYYVGIASYSSFLNTKIDSSVYDKYDVWVAHYGVNRPDYYGNFGMWQFTGSGSVEGVSTPVDRNYCYYDYPTIMQEYHFNGF